LVIEARSELELVDRIDEPSLERLADARLDVEPFERDTELASVGERAADRTLDGFPEVGVVEHEKRVLPTELHRAVDQVRSGLFGDRPARFRTPREHQVVRVLDERRTDLRAAA